MRHRIVLIDGPELARRMIAHGVGVRVRQRIEVKGIDADDFDGVQGRAGSRSGRNGVEVRAVRLPCRMRERKGTA